MSTRDQRLANIDKALARGQMTEQEAYDERILVRALGVADARRERLNAPRR